jgi:hypothetical protein
MDYSMVRQKGVEQSEKEAAAQSRLAPNVAIAARNRRPHTLLGRLVANALSRTRRVGEANR